MCKPEAAGEKDVNSSQKKANALVHRGGGSLQGRLTWAREGVIGGEGQQSRKRGYGLGQQGTTCFMPRERKGGIGGGL